MNSSRFVPYVLHLFANSVNQIYKNVLHHEVNRGKLGAEDKL